MNIAIAGAGSIGIAFAIQFAKAGYNVNVWDQFPEVFHKAKLDIEHRLNLLQDNGILKVSKNEIIEKIEFINDFNEAFSNADLIQECIPEKIELKKDFIERLGGIVNDFTCISSSSSAIKASSIADDCDFKEQILVGHPGNPPYLIPVIEVVPSEWTHDEIISKTIKIYENAELHPILVNKEVEGFVFNRLQGALLREAYCLVRDGVCSVNDIDTVVKLGLGKRWAVLGPFETVDLNTQGGIASHAIKMGPAYERMGSDRGQYDPWTPELVSKVVQQRRELLPLDKWQERVHWRDQQLMKITQLNIHGHKDDR